MLLLAPPRVTEAARTQNNILLKGYGCRRPPLVLPIEPQQYRTSVEATGRAVQLRVAHRVVQVPRAPEAVGAEVTVRPRQDGRTVLGIDTVIVVS